MSRLIQFGGTQSLELRLESFNLTNNFNWGAAGDLNLNQAQFGRITTQRRHTAHHAVRDQVQLLGRAELS